MSVRTFGTSALNPAPLLDVADVRSAQVEAFESEEQCPTDEIPTSSGCLRGFCWAIGIEAGAALCAYGAWRLWTFLQ
jgi:hypothetical protein